MRELMQRRTLAILKGRGGDPHPPGLAQRASVRDWDLDVPMPWPADYFQPNEPPNDCTPLAAPWRHGSAFAQSVRRNRGME